LCLRIGLEEMPITGQGLWKSAQNTLRWRWSEAVHRILVSCNPEVKGTSQGDLSLKEAVDCEKTKVWRYPRFFLCRFWARDGFSSRMAN
jgi:hypothetical protein